MRVENKKQMYELYQAGEFGNTLRTWNSYDEWAASGLTQNVTLRYRGPNGGAWCIYDLRANEVAPTIDLWAKQGADPRLVVFCEGAPDDKIIVQGELYCSPDKGWSFHHSFSKWKMRVALQIASHNAFGLRALTMLRHYMTPASHEDLQDLIERFPDHVIELSIYRINLGCLPRRNTLIWEVRSY